jgi:hypothetical protein
VGFVVHVQPVSAAAARLFGGECDQMAADTLVLIRWVYGGV